MVLHLWEREKMTDGNCLSEMREGRINSEREVE